MNEAVHAHAGHADHAAHAAHAAAAAEPAAKPAKKKAEVEKVRMNDGRELEFAGKRKLLKEAVFDSEGNWIGTQFDFRNGETRQFTAPAADLKLADGRFALQAFAAHGSLQKIGDETAGEEKIDDMVLAVEDIIERLQNREWTVEREGGGMAGTSILIKALVEHTGKTVDAIKAFLKGKTKAQKDAMKADKRVQHIVQRLEAEEAAKAAHVNTEELFGALDAA